VEGDMHIKPLPVILFTTAAIMIATPRYATPHTIDIDDTREGPVVLLLDGAPPPVADCSFNGDEQVSCGFTFEQPNKVSFNISFNIFESAGSMILSDTLALLAGGALTASLVLIFTSDEPGFFLPEQRDGMTLFEDQGPISITTPAGDIINVKSDVEIPVPATLALLGLALTGMGLSRHRLMRKR